MSDIEHLRAAELSGDGTVLDRLLSQYRERLKRVVRLRMGRYLQSRVDPSDIIQETYLDASRRLTEFLASPDVPFYIWLRSLTQQRLAAAFRRNLGTQARDVRREVPLDWGETAGADSEVLAVQFVAQLSSPSKQAIKAELRTHLQQVLEAMDPADREVLVLRHIEQLSNQDAALVLGIKPTAASNRYVRALERLRVALAGLAGDIEAP